MSRPLAIVVFVLAAALWVTFVLWTLRYLWRDDHDPYTRVVYRFGVRWGGIAMWVAMTVAFTLDHTDGLAGGWGRGFLAAFINLPIMLWGGYFFGRFMAFLYGLSRSA